MEENPMKPIYRHASGKPATNERRKSALARLENQLVTKTKTEKKTGNSIPLSEQDINRIKKEIKALQNKL